MPIRAETVSRHEVMTPGRMKMSSTDYIRDWDAFVKGITAQLLIEYTKFNLGKHNFLNGASQGQSILTVFGCFKTLCITWVKILQTKTLRFAWICILQHDICLLECKQDSNRTRPAWKECLPTPLIQMYYKHTVIAAESQWIRLKIVIGLKLWKLKFPEFKTMLIRRINTNDSCNVLVLL